MYSKKFQIIRNTSLTMSKKILLPLLGLSMTFGNIQAQNDTMYFMKAGGVINKQSIKAEDVDSVVFYKPSQQSNSTLEYLITGTGFGTKTSTPYYDDFEDRPTGAVGGTIGSLVVSTNTGTTIDGAVAHSGTKSLRHDYSIVDFPKIYKNLNNTSKVYFSCYLKFVGTISGGAVWKMARVGAGDAYTGTPRVGSSYTSSSGNTPQAFSGEVVSSNGIVGWSEHNTSSVNPASAFTNGSWHFYEMKVYTGTVNGNNMKFIESVDNKITVSIINREYLTSANSALLSWLLTPENGLDGSPSIIYNMDDIYIEESWARVVMTNSANYASSTKWEVQPVTSWSDTKITTAKRRGAFAIGEIAYLHTFDANDVLISTSSAFVVGEDTP